MAADRDIGEGESLQVRTPVIAGTIASLLVFVVIVAFGFMLFFPNRIGVRFVPHSAFPPPAVIAQEHGERLAIEGRQRRALAGAGGRLPIEQAMGQIAARGASAFDPVRP